MSSWAQGGRSAGWRTSPVPLTAWQWHFQVRELHESAVVPFDGTDRRRTRSIKMARVEAALLVAGGPLTLRKLVQVATLADAADATHLIDRLNEAYDLSRSPFRIERVATGFQLLARPEYAHWLGRLHQRQAELKLTPAAMETLTILAYRQPLTRADLESIRGVQCTDILKMLMERGLVRIAGEDVSLGRPFLYETTRKFLENYGLRNLDDLPNARELRFVRSGDASVEGAEQDTEAAA